jgi:hypothetical protein
MSLVLRLSSALSNAVTRNRIVGSVAALGGSGGLAYATYDDAPMVVRALSFVAVGFCSGFVTEIACQAGCSLKRGHLFGLVGFGASVALGHYGGDVAKRWPEIQKERERIRKVDAQKEAAEEVESARLRLAAAEQRKSSVESPARKSVSQPATARVVQ